MIIYWIDSGYSLITNRWQKIETIKKDFNKIDTIIESHGEIVWENEDWLLLASSVNKKTNQIKGGMFIYKRNILNEKKL